MIEREGRTSIKIPEAVQQRLAGILRAMEETSELTRCVVVTRTGIKIAPDMDADSYSASSAALIDLGERVVASLEHGTLEELVINAMGGYVILAAVGKEFMLLGATSAALKMGYYLPFVRKKAWELEAIIYGLKGAAAEAAPGIKAQEIPTIPVKQPAANENPEGGKISTAEIKAADIQAMNDVLAAFDEFGINDDFTKSLGDGAVPTVNISTEEMSVISQQIAQQEPAAKKITVEPAPASQAQKAPGAAEKAAQLADCPIPLEAGEVPPIPLSTEELVTEGGSAAVPEHAQAPISAVEAAPSSQVEVQAPPLAAAKAQVQQPVGIKAQAPQKAEPANASPAGAAPSFDNASEYDFDFDVTKTPEKEVVVPEQDSMSDTLKALGWEEEEDK
nr:roadblock/LC7 domain-containing protein [Candidatus Sigynarchaeum springense]MDO8119122.1 roadblock/LC7 domain-containing protein [Candidatus Sigynarchaeota archaeon]